jgi:hypothetical protein
LHAKKCHNGITTSVVVVGDLLVASALGKSHGSFIMSNRTLQELLPRVGTSSDYINAHFLAASRIPSLQHRWLLTETWVLKIKEHFNFSSSVKLDKATLNAAIARCNALGVLEIFDVAFNQTGIVKAVFSGRIGGNKSKKYTAYYSYA